MEILGLSNIPGSGEKYILVYDKYGGAPYQMPASVNSSGQLDTGGALAIGGLSSSTTGVTDSTDKRFVTDAELAAASDLATNKTNFDKMLAGTFMPVLLAANVAVDLNVDPEQTLYTVPAGKTCVVTAIVVRAASISLTTASFSIGFNAGTDNDVVADATHTELTGATLFTQLSPKTGAKLGAAADVLALKNNTKQGAAATARVDVIGYLY